jgi:Nif-specific regulatory protein
VLPEYRFFRNQYRLGDPNETALAFLSDATIRRWCGPQWRIADSRRTRARAVLAELQASQLDALVKKTVKRISTPAIDLLLAYHWPGNVRELENCIERAVLLAGGDTIDSIHLPPSLQMKTAAPEKKHHGKLESLVNTYERSLIIDAMKDAKGNQSQAARLLGTTKRIIQYKVEKYAVDAKRFKAKKT